MTSESPAQQPGDNSAQLAWTTPAAALAAVTGGGVLLAVATIFAGDAPARLLIGLAAVGLLGLAGLGFRQRPRLSVVPGADPRMVVRTLFGPDEYTREQIIRARVVDYRRLGRKMPMLEIDVYHADSERLLIFGRWDLGARPDEVHTALVRALRLSGKTTR